MVPLNAPQACKSERAPWQVLAGRLTTCRDGAERDALVARLIRVRSATVVAFLNAHACNLATASSSFHEALKGSDYLLRDGVGVELHLLLRGRPAGLNLNGTDLIPDLIEAMLGRGTIALYGTRAEYLEAAAAALRERGASVDTLHGFHRSDRIYLDRARATRPRLIVLGMGMPKQELLALRLREALADTPVLIVNGGAVIDFLAGRYARAPSLVRRMRLESLYRLSREPRRLWWRNVGSLVFLWRSVSALVDERRVARRSRTE